MTILEFTLAMINQLTWPVVIIIALLLLRSPLVRLIPKARTIKYKELEIDFSQELRSATQHADTAFNSPDDTQKSQLIQHAKNFPNETIRKSWRAVDDTAEKLIMTLRPDIQLPENERYKALETELSDDNLLSGAQIKLFSELRQLRNKVAHADGFEVGSSDALLYVELCFQMIRALQQALQRESSLT